MNKCFRIGFLNKRTAPLTLSLEGVRKSGFLDSPVRGRGLGYTGRWRRGTCHPKETIGRHTSFLSEYVGLRVDLVSVSPSAKSENRFFTGF